MADPKQLNIWGLMGKLEASYNAGATVSASTDAIWILDNFIAELDYANDGKRASDAPGTNTQFQRLHPSGRFVKGTPRIEARGAGVAYSASQFPPDVHVPLRISGHSATFSGGVGAEVMTYQPQALNDSSWASGYFEAYARNQKYVFQGCYCDFNFSIDGPGTMICDFPIMGLNPALPTDVAVPSLTYLSLTTFPPKAESIALTIGNFTAGVVRKCSFKKQQKISPRLNVNAPGHAGFGMGSCDPVFSVTVEACTQTGATPWTAASTLNPYGLRDSALPVSVSFILGPASVYNRIKFTAPNAQLVAVKEAADGATALWELEFDLAPSSPILSDEYALAFTNT